MNSNCETEINEMTRAISSMEYKCLKWSLVSFSMLLLILFLANVLSLESGLLLQSLSLMVGLIFSICALYLWVCAIRRTVRADLPITRKVFYLLAFLTLTFFASTYYYFSLSRSNSNA
jgi:hypothetical protein